ncbi:bacillithiol system redox-active protein YtxJ [Salirhabdus salicampi]|uniref:bacillithiol system redox-active protein YtxJ n=1 Tax=Salirhabdus salicampi TaxID=476102 RepID=UPI0020C2A614|nr:bacillithiol system redox-active protein YtxJ [Salirhabdus salicampi]MCP8617146.1 bacillithiol system redox-active protein YtxJ [Salirhabdus salicampi]
MGVNVIEKTEQFQEVLEQQHTFFLLKHSLTCPISSEAKEQYERFWEEAEIPQYVLYVQEARPLSNHIAETFDVKHESPQALLFHGKEVVWHTSHWNITKEALHAAAHDQIKRENQ